MNYPGNVRLWKVGVEKPTNLVLDCENNVANHTASVKWWVCETFQITFMDGISGLEEHNKKEHSKTSPGHSPGVPSSPESFHGFVTPTKELEMSKRFETIILNLSDI